jgi:hypothetical protein
MPVWFVWNDEGVRPAIYFLTASHSQKARNLSAQPRAIAHLGDGDDVVIVEGDSLVIEPSSELDQFTLAYGQKYVDPGSGNMAAMAAHDNLYRLGASSVVAWMYGTASHWTEWRFD